MALEAATYVDMAVRGRAPSEVPGRAVDRVARLLRVDLERGGGPAAAEHRRVAVGTLLGYVNGIGTGLVFARVARPLPDLPFPATAAALAGLAMLAGNAGAVATGSTDPRRWSAADWVSDLVPHACFGIAGAAALARCRGGAPAHHRRRQ